jgi:hypothetical protein
MNSSKRRLVVNVTSNFNEKLFSFDNNHLHAFLSAKALTG